jgi:hypothetical protein
MMKMPRTRWGAARLLALTLLLGVLVYRIGFYQPAPIINPAYQSSLINPAH